MSSTALSLGPRASAGLRHTLLTQFSVPSMQATSDTYPLLGGERPGEPEPLGGSFGSFDSECPKALTSLCWPKDIFNGDLRLAGYVFTHKAPPSWRVSDRAEFNMVHGEASSLQFVVRADSRGSLARRTNPRRTA